MNKLTCQLKLENNSRQAAPPHYANTHNSQDKRTHARTRARKHSRGELYASFHCKRFTTHTNHVNYIWVTFLHDLMRILVYAMTANLISVER